MLFAKDFLVEHQLPCLTTHTLKQVWTVSEQ